MHRGFLYAISNYLRVFKDSSFCDLLQSIEYWLEKFVILFLDNCSKFRNIIRDFKFAFHLAVRSGENN